MAGLTKTLVLGIGNPLFGDDGVGLEVARRIEQVVRGSSVDVVEASASGLELLDVIAGYDRLIVVDSIITQDGGVGKLHRLETSDLLSFARPVGKHQMNLITTLEFARRLNLDMPRETVVYAVAIEETRGLSESCSPEVVKAIPNIVEAIVKGEALARS